MNNFLKIVAICLCSISCTDLVELPLDGDSPKAGGLGASDLLTIKKKMSNLFDAQNKLLWLDELSADALMGPTRGGDWDDNAELRQLHAHTWGPDHVPIKNVYNDLLTGIFNCDLILNDASKSAEHNEAKFYKAFFYYHLIDKFGQVPYRDLDKLASLDDPKVYTRTEATNLAIKLLEEISDNLPVRTANDPSAFSKDAAYFLLAKFYLNKNVFTTEPAGSYDNFEVADMTKVIDYVNKITASLTPDDATGKSYWDNFSPTNNTSNEIIYSIKHEKGDDTFGNMQFYWRMGTHYNMIPGGWNGPIITGEYYDKYQENDVPEGGDKRITYSTPEIIETLGNNVGVLRGPVKKPGGTETVLDRKKVELNFTKKAELVITDPKQLESAGYRSLKYIPQVDVVDGENTVLNKADHDCVIFRYSDALLMAAEARLRGGTGSGDTAQVLLDKVRARVGLAPITANIENVYSERARELWLELWRRNDMIRFGKFLDPKEYKKTKSDPKCLLYPMPADALVNSNITQNPGY